MSKMQFMISCIFVFVVYTYTYILYICMGSLYSCVLFNVVYGVVYFLCFILAVVLTVTVKHAIPYYLTA